MTNVDTSTTVNDDVAVEVRSGWGPVEIGDALQQAGVIGSSVTFQQIAQSTGITTFVAGRYDFIEGSGEREALDTLRGGPVTIVPDLKLLLPPGLTIGQIAQRVGQLEGKSEARFLEVARSNLVRSKYEPADVTSLEGLTWPDTYFIGANETETQILQKIVGEFDKRADAISLAGAAQFGLTPYQAIINASLIQAEAGSNEDAPLISAVIVNRLREGMLLQIDATLCYAKGGCPPGPVDADRRRDSPYNTYQHAGLPPTPIATVGETAFARRGQPRVRQLPLLRLRQERQNVLRGDSSRARTQRGARPERRVSDSRLARALDLVATTEPRDVDRALAVGGLVVLVGGTRTRGLGGDGLPPVRARSHEDPETTRRDASPRLVDACRALDPPNTGKNASAARWHRDRARVLRRLDDDETAPAVVRVHGACALHAHRVLTAELRQRGPDVWAERDVGATDQLWYSRSLAIVLAARAPGMLGDEMRATVRALEELAGWWFDVGHPQFGRRSR